MARISTPEVFSFFPRDSVPWGSSTAPSVTTTIVSPGLGPSDDRLFYGIALRPNVLLVLVPDHVAVSRLEPLDAGHTRVVVDWLFDRDTMAGDGFDATDAVALLDLTNRAAEFVR